MAIEKKCKNPEYHHLIDVNPEADKMIEKILNFFDDNGLTFYDIIEGQKWAHPKVDEKAMGRQRYAFITVSVKIS